MQGSKKKKRKGVFKDPSNINVTIITVLLLAIISYIVLHYLLKS